jgi:hypothetical protein
LSSIPGNACRPFTIKEHAISAKPYLDVDMGFPGKQRSTFDISGEYPSACCRIFYRQFYTGK